MLTLNNLLRVAIFIAGIVLGTLLTNLFRSGEKQLVSTSPFKPTVSLTFDTVYVQTPPKIQYVEVERPTVRTVYKDRLIPVKQPDGTPTLAVRRYQDTVKLEDNLHVNYDAEVTGTLDGIRLGLVDRRPQQVIRQTISIDTPVPYPVQTTGLYVGGYTNLNGKSFGPQINLVTPKLNFGINYDLRNKTDQHLMKSQVSVGYKLFGPK